MKHIDSCHVGPSSLWFIGWLFTIGFLGLGWGQGVLAVVVWPYYIGRFVSGILG